MKNIEVILASLNLRDTQPRRMVLQALFKSHTPRSHKEIYDSIQKKKGAINLVTVYRILSQFQEVGIVHLHPTTGKYVLCTEPHNHACHIFMTCEQCGNVQEVHDEKLCTEERRIAKKAGFQPKYHVSDVVGVCSQCK